MTATGNDCYYYYSGTCMKGGNCNFRHQPAALGSEVTCDMWKQGICARPVCEFRHAILNKNNGLVKCMWENQPSGCLKPNCTFLHTKPKHVPSSVPGFLPHPPFSSTGPVFRPPPGLGRGEHSQFVQERSKGAFGSTTMSFLDKHLTPGVPMSSGIAVGGQISLTNSTSLLGNPPALVDMVGADPSQMLLNLSNEDNSLQEQVKLFQQMLNRLGKQESPKKDKDKSKRRVIPKNARSGDSKDIGFDKAERKRESSKKKRNKEKTKKPERRDRTYKSKGKSERKRREERSPNFGGEKDLDADSNDREREPSDFTESPKSRRSSSEYEDLDFGVKSYEEILREKALRNLLEKKKLREQNETGVPDESTRAKIEEIEKELREVSRARKKKEREDGEQGTRKENEESVKEGCGTKDDVNLEDSGVKDMEEARIEGEELDSQLDGDIGSPVSSEISLQADDEDLSFGEDERQSGSPQKRLSSVAKPKKESKRNKEREKRKEKSKDHVDREADADDQGRNRTDRNGAREGKRVVSLVKEEPKVDIGKEGEQAPVSLNRSLDLGIKTFEEIMAEKRQRRKTAVSESEPVKQPVSVVKPQVGSLDLASVSQKEEVGNSGSQLAKIKEETNGKKANWVLRQGLEQDKVDETKHSEPVDEITKHKQQPGTFAPASAARAVSVAKKEATKPVDIPVINAPKVPLEPVASPSVSETKQETPVKVKSFEEIMREKRARQQLTQLPKEIKQKKKDGKNNELKGPRSTGTEVRRKGVSGSDDAARARRFMAATAIGMSSSKSEGGAVGPGTVTDRTRRLLLKRPSTKPKANVDNVEASEVQRSQTSLRTAHSKPADAIPVEVSNVETAGSSAVKTSISAVATITATVASFKQGESVVAPLASLRSEGNESVVARVSPFCVTTAETPSSSTEQQTCVSSTITAVASSSVTKDEAGTRSHKPLKSPRERRKSESTRKRRSNEEPKTSEEPSHDDEHGPSPTKRARPTSRKGSSIVKDIDDSEPDEAFETEERRNSEILLDEELEREIANLSPLSGEEYDEIDEDDLLMEVEAIINE